MLDDLEKYSDGELTMQLEVTQNYSSDIEFLPCRFDFTLHIIDSNGWSSDSG